MNSKITEKDLIKKIEILKEIKPERDWLLNTKKEISGVKGSPIFGNLLENRAFLFVPSLVTVLIIAVLLYSNLNNISEPKIVSLDPEVLEAITTGLRTVEVDVLKVTQNIEKVKEPKQVLEIKEKVDSTIENGERIVFTFKELIKEPDKKPDQVLTTLNKVEEAFDDLEKTYLEKQKELTKQLIEDLEKENLTQEQELILEQAKQYFEQENYSEALIKAIETSEKTLN